jgi:small-conductance mechanosensitive channel
VGIGFGLQNIVNNFVSGLIILSERVIQVGDRVQVANTTGRVVRIGARSTSILTNDNSTMIVPNSEFVSAPVVNWSYEGDVDVRLKVSVGVGYGSDPRQVEKLLLAVAAENPHILEDPAPDVVFCGFGASSLGFDLRFWTRDMNHYRAADDFKPHQLLHLQPAAEGTDLRSPAAPGRHPPPRRSPGARGVAACDPGSPPSRRDSLGNRHGRTGLEDNSS